MDAMFYFKLTPVNLDLVIREKICEGFKIYKYLMKIVFLFFWAFPFSVKRQTDFKPLFFLDLWCFICCDSSKVPKSFWFRKKQKVYIAGESGMIWRYRVILLDNSKPHYWLLNSQRLTIVQFKINRSKTFSTQKIKNFYLPFNSERFRFLLGLT